MISSYTPVQYVPEWRVWLKREDLFEVYGVRGGKARACHLLAAGATGLVTAGARHSPQVEIVAHIARGLKVPCYAHMPWAGGLTHEIFSAREAGAVIIEHRPGYNSVIVARAREDAQARGYTEIPFGMECQAAVDGARLQVDNLPAEAERVVVPVGSGMSLAGILWGLTNKENQRLPVLGVVVGADPRKRLDRWAPRGWSGMVELVPAGVPYEARRFVMLGEANLDPVYEAKTVPFVRAGDVLWVVGRRRT